MSKMKEFDMLVNELVKHGEGILEIAKEMRQMFSEKPTALSEPKDDPKESLSFTDLRARLAQRSREGFTADIKSILRKYGAEKLSAIKPENYEDVLREVEALSHE